MKVLLSIKPSYAESIFKGEKIYEYRRSIFKRRGVNTIVVYSSSPIQRVIGEFEIDCVLERPLNCLWEETGRDGGIDEQYFFEYFQGKECGFAIKVKNAKLYDHPQKLDEVYGVKPPQSFLYLD